MEQEREAGNKPEPQEASCVTEKVIQRSDKEIAFSPTLWAIRDLKQSNEIAPLAHTRHKIKCRCSEDLLF